MFKQHAHTVNDSLCKLLEPVLDCLIEANNHAGHQLLEDLWIDSAATNQITERISRFENLKELRLTNCAYATGEFLNNIRSNQLATVDFSSSYQIEFKEILECVQNNGPTIKKISIDGESVKRS